MLAIRMQRTGRKGHAQFRLVVQDSRRTPTSGNIVYLLGNYNPHSKELSIDKEKVSFYLSNGAQPSPTVVKLLKQDGVKLPKWVTPPAKKEASIKNTDKLRRNRPPEEKAPEPKPEAEAPVEQSEPAAEAEAKPEEVESTDQPDKKDDGQPESTEATEPEPAKEEAESEAPKEDDAGKSEPADSEK